MVPVADDFTMVQCICGRTAVVKTAWTTLNPGRRFYTCPEQDSSCPFIRWLDPPMCARSTVIIPGLLRNINNLQASVHELEKEVVKWKIWVFSSLVFIVAVMMWSV